MEVGRSLPGTSSLGQKPTLVNRQVRHLPRDLSPRSKAPLHTVNGYLFIYLDCNLGTTPIHRAYSKHTYNIEQ